MGVFDKALEQRLIAFDNPDSIPRSIRKWHDLLVKHQEEENGGILQDWFSALEPLRGRGDAYILQAVNERVNGLRYVLDQISTGKRDAWLTPLTTLRWGGGDCEDLAILKLFMLRYLGFVSTELVLVTQEFGPYHAVCITRSGGRRCLLDNQFTRVHDAEPAARFMGYKPRRGMNTTHWWKYE